ncbi:hypothetical protein [Pararhizobium sp.]|uniref:hypothetical protein n=1 Tax=Pararhizobium sp. TaxID=1977563 RepID=UPI0027207540|nr:hypothetical protein [Pararhizobium sp.]MDO9415819.1 hypothetical protein [Pararhizobium sp.]
MVAGPLALAGCRTARLSDEERAQQAEIQRLDWQIVISECALVDQLNEGRELGKKKVISERDCAHARKKGSMEGYSDKIVLPNVMINNLILPFGSIAFIAQDAKTISDAKRAASAEIPSAIASKGAAAEMTYRRKIRRGFEQDEIVGLAGSGEFSAAVHDIAAGQAFAAAHRKVP